MNGRSPTIALLKYNAFANRRGRQCVSYSYLATGRYPE
jgi:hypothetical protein